MEAKEELQQIISDQADQIAALIERNDQLIDALNAYKSIAHRALDLAEEYRTEAHKLRRTISDIVSEHYKKVTDNPNVSLDINFPNTEG